MAGMTAAAKETAAQAVATSTNSWISLHTADPGSAGTTGEATGGSYARQQTTWSNGASDGVVTGSEVTIDVAAGTYTYVGLWTAVTSGTFIGSVAITSTTLGAAGQIKVTPTYTQS